MPDKDKIEFLLKLAEAAWCDYNERRSIEGKTNFALCLALGAFGGFMFEHPTELPLWIALMTSTILVGIFLAYTFLWKREIQKRNSLDLDAAQYYWAQVDDELGLERPAIRTRSKNGKWRPTHLTQVFITLLFVLLATLPVWILRWVVLKSSPTGEPLPNKSLNSNAPTPGIFIAR